MIENINSGREREREREKKELKRERGKDVWLRKGIVRVVLKECK